MNNSKTFEAFKASDDSTIIVQNMHDETYKVTLDWIEGSNDYYQYLAQMALNEHETIWTAYDGPLFRTGGPQLTSEELDALFNDPKKFVLPVRMTDDQIVITSRERADFFGITEKKNVFKAYESLDQINDILFNRLYCFIIQEIDSETYEDFGDQIVSDFYLDNDWDSMESNLSNNINDYRIIEAE